MQTTWPATVARCLLATGIVLALVLAVALTRSGAGSWTTGTAWLLASSLMVGAGVWWFRLRQVECFRRHLAIGLTHHLRTSLTHIQTFNEMLILGQESSEEERQKWLEVIGREAERLGAAVDNVLLIVTDRRSDMYPVRRAVDLGALLEDVGTCYSSSGAGELLFEPGPPSGIMVNADPAALRHALGNLLESVGRCCGQSYALSAALTSDESKATIQVGLKDATGVMAQRLGDGAQLRANDLESETGVGFGLEMAVVQHVARAHGGRAVPFHDRKCSGFRLELPIWHPR